MCLICSVSGPPPSVIDVERVRSKLEGVKARKAAAAASVGDSTSEQQRANQQQAAGARAALDKRLASSGGRLQVLPCRGHVVALHSRLCSDLRHFIYNSLYERHLGCRVGGRLHSRLAAAGTRCRAAAGSWTGGQIRQRGAAGRGAV